MKNKPLIHLRELRKENDLSLQQLSSETGISFSALSAYERGTRSPKSEQLNKLANRFNVTPAYIESMTNYRTGEDISKHLENIQDENKKRDFIKHLNAFELNMLIDEDISGNTVNTTTDEIELLNVAIKDNKKRIRELNQQRENFIKNNMYANTINQLIQRNDDIDEDEELNITYKNELELVYYLHLVQDNLLALKRDKVGNATFALKDVLNNDDVVVSDELKEYSNKINGVDDK